MKKVNKTKVFMWVLAAIPLILVAAVYNRLPAEVPHNWGLNGEVAYGGKSMLWWLAGGFPVLAALFALLPKIDPRRKNYGKFKGFYDGFCLIMMLFMLGIMLIVLSESFYPGRISVGFAVTVACGVLFTVLGNMMPKVKSNFFMGVRTPWTLSSSEVWNKTHRLAGFLFFFGGLLTIALAFFLDELPLFIALMAIVAVVTALPCAMSYVWYKKMPPCETGRRDDANGCR